MPIDFHEEYKHYSNADLLMIVRQPNEYQSAAVEAAAKILEQREVTEEERGCGRSGSRLLYLSCIRE